MTFVENNGKKIAAALCVASCFPVVATVYAMETEPGWHGDKYIKNDSTVAKGWEEIEGKSYYFSEEDGTVEKEITQKAVVASVSTRIMDDVQDTVSTVTKETVHEELSKMETQPSVEISNDIPIQNIEETVVTENEVINENQQAVEEDIQSEMETPNVEQPNIDIEVKPEIPENPNVDDSMENDSVEVPNMTPEVNEEINGDAMENGEETTPETDVPNLEEPSLPEVEPNQPTPNEENTAPEVVEPEVPEVQAPVNPYADLNARIAEAAKTLVGVTDGYWCTEVVQQALALAGVSDALQLWPDQYVGQYGYYTDTPQVGNLIYYNNGGRGVDHIAIYIGDGLAVHGNYNGRTVIETVYVPGGAPQFIQVCR